MNAQTIERLAESFVANSPLNSVCLNANTIALFEAPLFGYASADDPVFFSYLRSEAIGPHYRLPNQWLPGARSVISFFLPFSTAVRDSNRGDRRIPGKAWLYGRIEGQQMVAALCEYLCDALQQVGFEAVSPSLSDDFWTISPPEIEGGPEFTSNWSERHAAYACGLGTLAYPRD